MDEVPSLMREIGEVAWLMAKIVGGVCAVVLPIVLLGRYHPMLAMILAYALLFSGMIVYFGWQNYKWKLRDLESKRKWEQAVERNRRIS